MRPTVFHGATHILRAPDGVGNAEDLVVRCTEHDFVEQVSCWEIEPGDLAEIVRTGRVWLRVCGPSHPLVSVEAFQPFGDESPVAPPDTVRIAPPPIVGGSRGPRGWQ